MSRSALCLLLLCIVASPGVVARDFRMDGPGSGGGNTQQCQEESIEAAVAEAAPKAVKPRATVTTPSARKPAKATPAARSASDTASRIPAPRWHSFLPGMFR